MFNSTQRPRRLMKLVLTGVGAAALTASTAAAEPALWKVQSAHATVYLFGTVHVLKPTTVWHSPKIDAAFNASGTLYEEIVNADDQAAAQPLIMKYGVDVAHPLSTKLDEAGRAKLAEVAIPLGVSPAQLEPLRPWVASVTISLLPLVRAGYDPKSGVDLKLKALAADQHKPLEGFETLEQQIHFFADLPQKLETDYLLDTLDSAKKGTSELDELVDAWAAGDTPRLEKLLNADMRDKYPELYRILLVQRNQAFAAKIEDLLKGQGTYFVAVGAAHLVGSDGVPADLAKDGLRVERQ
ncbi:MAG: TraB/GumN family protein [Pseudomonadota bacterium]|nr:TraB/GumN family protein [Pseudomonadota bacterium]